MKKNNEEFISPSPYDFSFDESMEMVYEKPVKVRVMLDSTSGVPKDGSKGDIIFTKIKNKDALGLHDGNQWKYAILYTAQELKDFDRKISELESKLLRSERRG